MRNAIFAYTRTSLFAALVFAAGTLAGSAEPIILLPSASLPLIGVPYQSTGVGAGCFTLASACVTPGPFVQTSATTSFSGGNEIIVADATYSAELTSLVGNTPIGSVSLTGTLHEVVFGRTSDTETGTFATDITSISLSGSLSLPPSNPLNGAIIELALNPSDTSAGVTSITADGALYQITSFFDVFVDVSLQGTDVSADLPLITLVAVPEPSTWAMLLAGFAGLGFAAYRRARAALPAA